MADIAAENCASAPLFPSTSLPGGNSEREPPDSISNSEVKTFSADGSVGSPHVRVGHRQALYIKRPQSFDCGLFLCQANFLFAMSAFVDLPQCCAIDFCDSIIERFGVALLCLRNA